VTLNQRSSNHSLSAVELRQRQLVHRAPRERSGSMRRPARATSWSMKHATPSSMSPKNSQRPRRATCTAATMQHHLPACAQLRRLTAAPAAAGHARGRSCWARARWTSLRWRSSTALRLWFDERWLSVTIRSDIKKQPEHVYTAPAHRGLARAARTLRLRPHACPAAADAGVKKPGSALAGK
jgi:hypothetical protein